ncbi:hypothetical protein HanIR_Chr11g0536261 [Helianthus annuus]|nr:hypothetical protein HanIR_Chr11g0536261 [Helianthus annuus]
MKWVLTLDKLDGGLGMKRVKQSKYGKKSIVWMRGKLSLHPLFITIHLLVNIDCELC